MGKKVLVYTALFGGYDCLLEPDFDDNKCDYICITDDRTLVSKKWNIQLCDEKSNPIEMNRMYKMLPHRFFKEYDYTLYVDSNVKLLNSPFEIINNYMSKSSIAFPKHFMRDCIYDEALFCLKHNKITDKEHTVLIENLLKVNGFPKRFGLAENNILIRNLRDESLNNTMEEWWSIFNSYAARDQLSLMYLLWKQKINFTFMSESSRNKNSYFSYALHNHIKSKSTLKNQLLLMSATRDKNILNKIVAKILDRL